MIITKLILMKPNKWDYKGTETAINGLTKWMYSNTDMNSYRKMLNLIIQFGFEHELYTFAVNYDSKADVHIAADTVAKQIQEKQLFQQFTDWVIKNIIT